MRTLVIFVHPYLEHSHSNRELINFYVRHNKYTFRDLYEDYPDFHIEAFKERKRLKNFDRIIFHFPLIWYGMPPLLKLWIDEVLSRDWLSNDDENPIKGKEVFILMTTTESREAFEAQGIVGKRPSELLSSLTTAMRMLGANIKEIETIYRVDKLTKKELVEEKQRLISLLQQH